MSVCWPPLPWLWSGAAGGRGYGRDAASSLRDAMRCLTDYSPELAASVRRAEDATDHWEDIIGTYLVKLSAGNVSARDSAEAAMLLKVIGDLERISDHAVNLVDSAEEIRSKGLRFSQAAEAELANLRQAVEEILSLAQAAFVDGDMRSALTVEPLEQVIDRLKDRMRNEHILRLQQGTCTIETGFVWSDILTNLERSPTTAPISPAVSSTPRRKTSTSMNPCGPCAPTAPISAASTKLLP